MISDENALVECEAVLASLRASMDIISQTFVVAAEHMQEFAETVRRKKNMKFTRKARASRIVSSCFAEARKAGVDSLRKALKTYGRNNWRKFHHLPMRRGYVTYEVVETEADG